MPFAIALVASWRAWPAVRDRLAEMGVLNGPHGHGVGGRLDACWRLLLATINRDGLAASAGWLLTRGEARLLWLSLAGLLAWPYVAVEDACGSQLVALPSDRVIFAVFGLTVLLVLAVVVRPPAAGRSAD